MNIYGIGITAAINMWISIIKSGSSEETQYLKMSCEKYGDEWIMYNSEVIREIPEGAFNWLSCNGSLMKYRCPYKKRQEYRHKWSVWIDKTRKIILCKKMPETRKVSFDNGNIGIKEVSLLAANGYKVGWLITVTENAKWAAQRSSLVKGNVNKLTLVLDKSAPFVL